MKPWLKITLGILLSVFIIAFIIVWDTVIKERIDSVDVVVVRPGVIIDKHEVIARDKLIVEKRKQSTLIEGSVFKMEDVIGYEANRTIYGNEILSERDVNFVSFSPNAEKGEAIRPIPNEWIYASPSTIRREDYIDFYLFKPVDNQAAGEEKEASVNINYQGLSPEQKVKLEEMQKERKEANDQYKEEREKIATDKHLEVEADSISLEEIEKSLQEDEAIVKGKETRDSQQDITRKRILNELTLSETEWKSLINQGEIPVLVDIPIIYVKDGSGNEIQNGEESTEEKRLTATGTVTDLEVILTEDEYRLIKDYMEQGYRLYITYN